MALDDLSRTEQPAPVGLIRLMRGSDGHFSEAEAAQVTLLDARLAGTARRGRRAVGRMSAPRTGA